jgi:cohesin loading factor subunit SCC2
MYSEDLLSLAVSLTKDQMSEVIFPVVSCIGGDSESSPRVISLYSESSSVFLNRVVASEMSAPKGSKATSTFVHPTLSQILRSTLIALPRITSLISRTDMSFSDSLVIQAVYLSISPLFLPESATAPKKKAKEKAAVANQITSLMKTFRMEAMGCLRAVSCRFRMVEYS